MGGSFSANKLPLVPGVGCLKQKCYTLVHNISSQQEIQKKFKIIPQITIKSNVGKFSPWN